MPPDLKIGLISAFWEWAEKEGLLIYLQVHADHGTQLPDAFIVDGQIILNITSEATRQLHFDSRSLSFQGRFGGKVFSVSIPAERISAIFIKDSTIGLTFPITDSPSDESDIHSNNTEGASLKIVSNTRKPSEETVDPATIKAPLKRVRKASPAKKTSSDKPKPAPKKRVKKTPALDKPTFTKV